MAQGDPIVFDVEYEGQGYTALCYPFGAEQNDVRFKIDLHDGDFQRTIARSARVNVFNEKGRVREVVALMEPFFLGIEEGKRLGRNDLSFEIRNALGLAFAPR